MVINWTTTDLDQINALSKGTLLEHIDILITEVTEDSITGTMPVDKRTIQPHKILHGGASLVLAETLGSLASNFSIDLEKKYAAGVEINANHIRPAKSGRVTGKATPIHLGKTRHVWDIKIYNEEQKLSCISRLTIAILDLIPRERLL